MFWRDFSEGLVSHCLCLVQDPLVGLQLAAAYAGLGGTWERPCCELKPAATSARLGAASQEAQVMLSLDASYFGFVDLSDILRKSTVQAKVLVICL